MADVSGKTLPNPPYKVAGVDRQGYFTPAWMAFFRQAFNRMGGSVALSNTELAGGVSTSIASINAQIVQLQDDVQSLQDLTGDGLSKGPNL
jgi:hypothetical protein